MLRAWEVVLEGKAYAKRPQCGNCAGDYRPVVLLNNLFQLVSYIIQERLVRIVEESNILEPGQGGFRSRRGSDINVHKLDYITRETLKTTSNPFVRIDVDFENVFNSVSHENLWAVACPMRTYGQYYGLSKSRTLISWSQSIRWRMVGRLSS